MVDNKVIRNHILLKTIKWLRLLYRQKENPYPLVMISRDLIIYRDRVIYFETGLVELEIVWRFTQMPLNWSLWIAI